MTTGNIDDQNWRQRPRAKILFVVVAAGVLAVLSALVWPTLRTTLGLDPNTLPRLGVAAIMFVTFFMIGILVYFVAGKTLWDLLQLLIVPLALAGIGLWFTAQQDARQQDIENQRAKEQLAIENQRAEAETLQAYLDQMSHLILDENLSDSEEGSPVRTLAQARTLAVLETLDDPQRKLTVIRFLYQSKLIVDEHPVVRLEAADLRDISFYESGVGTSPVLTNANFDFAHLSGSQLTGVHLDHAYLRRAELAGARLHGANLEGADLTEARLGSTIGARSLGGPLEEFKAADLSGANLSHATLTNAQLYEVDMSPLEKSTEELGLLRDEGHTNLSDANLRYAVMNKADLPHTILDGADFKCADLRGVDFTGATGITWKQLENQARHLAGATMPDGKIYVQQQPSLQWCPGPASP